ncbi:MAG: hypothetical protein H0V09_09340 [Gemmatimonadetes bacterium]|nr:hypothetical protein [Gemmatimonadota bacterium]
MTRSRAGTLLSFLLFAPQSAPAAATSSTDLFAAADTLRPAASPDAEYHRGLELLARGDARGASAAFERALARGYRPPAEAYLQLGLSRRHLPLHAFDAIRAFRQVLREDPASTPGLYELADTYLALDGWEGQREARRALVTLLEREPGYRDAYSRWSALYPDVRESRRLAEAFGRHLAADFRPELALHTARLHLQTGELEQLVELLDLWSSVEASASSLRLYAAGRLLFDKGHDADATREFRAGIQAARQPEDLEPYWEDVAPLMDAEELAAARAGDTPSQVAFLLGFWEARDPLPFSDANERLAEQYRRISEARRRYLWKKPFAKEKVIGDYVDDLGRPSFDTRLEGRSLDDRGTIYLRHGEPDQRHVEVGGDEFWRYRRTEAPGGRLHFHFKLMEGPMGRGNDTVYSVLPTTDIGDSNVRVGHAGQEGVANTLVGLSTDTFVPSGGPAILPLQARPFTFRSLADRSRTDLLLAWEAASDSSLMPGSPSASRVLARMKLYDEAYAELLGLTDTLSPNDLAPARAGGSAPFAGAFELSTYAGDHAYAVQVETPDASSVALGRGQIEIPSYAGDGLQMSDLLLASRVTPASADPAAPTRAGLALHPLVQPRVSRRVPLSLYYEIYELRPLGTGRVRYRVEYRVSSDRPVRRGLLQRIFGAAAGEAEERPDGVSLAFEKERPGPLLSTFETISLDLSALLPGTYTVTAVVQDLVTGVEVERRALLELGP